VNTPSERSLAASRVSSIQLVSHAPGAVGSAWMAQAAGQNCPSCDGPVLAHIGHSPYDHDARAELRPWPILEGAEGGGVHSHG
jgi:hypothetical protein